MLKEQLNLLKNAYECYFSDQRENIEQGTVERNIVDSIKSDDEESR